MNWTDLQFFWVNRKAVVRKPRPKPVQQMPICLTFDWFIEIVKTDPRFIGLFWEPSVHATVMYDGCAFSVVRADHIFGKLLACQLMREWLAENHVNFGSASTAPRHWIISDREYKTAFAAPVEVARQWVERQRRPRRGN